MGLRSPAYSPQSSAPIVFVGDIIHVAAVQAPDPEITIAYDVNPAMAASVPLCFRRRSELSARGIQPGSERRRYR
jgi:hypothetical protein